MALRTMATWRVATRSCHYPFKTAPPALRKLYSTPSKLSGSPTSFTAEIAKSSLVKLYDFPPSPIEGMDGRAG